MKPIETGSRIRIIDAIRGFSLLGILIANMLIFQYGIYGQDELQHFDPTSLDTVTHQVLNIVVEGSFLPIFMFLFGYSLYKLRESFVLQGSKPGWPLARRFLMLFVVGMLHGLLLWEGDILQAYGIMGFILLLFVKRKPKTLMIWGIVLIVLMAGLSYGLVNETANEEAQMQDYVTQSIEVYSRGSYSEIVTFRMNEDPLNWSIGKKVAILFVFPVIMLPMFVFGIAAAKGQWFHNPRHEKRRYMWLSIILLPLGLVLKSFGVLQPDSPWSEVFITAGGPMLALGYMFTLALVLSQLQNKAWLVSAFEAVGRMSMTNYLMQTVVCTMLFYGYGLGWFGQIGVLNGCLLALLLYTVQAALTSLMLRRFKNGPVERILRMWTYWSFGGKRRALSKVVHTPDLDSVV